MNNCMQLDLKFDLSMVDIKDATFHRYYSRRQVYNRELHKDFTPVPISSYTMPKRINDMLIEQLPDSVLRIERPPLIVMKIDASSSLQPTLAPHVDLNRFCTINVYLEAHGERTHFYDWDASTKQLTENESFVANHGDCWLLNVQVPHSVSMVPNKARAMLGFSFVKSKYAEVKDALGLGEV